MPVQDNLIQGNIGLCATHDDRGTALLGALQAKGLPQAAPGPCRPGPQRLARICLLAASNGSHETMAADGLHQVEHVQSPRLPT